MPRQKLSEYRAKQILTTALELISYQGWSIDAEQPLDGQLSGLPADGRYAVKVDQAVKGRFKKGLVILDVTFDRLPTTIKSLAAKGYQWMIIEPQLTHEASDEHYLSITSERGGLQLRYAAQGGVDIEAHPETITQVALNGQTNWAALSDATGFSQPQLQRLQQTFKEQFFSFLEINPYLAGAIDLQLLDAAVEVDDAGAYFVNGWQLSDIRRYSATALTSAEQTVLELSENSPAAFTLSVLEPNGSIFLLLSGGGASVVVADEVYHQGYGEQLANYGEYSGNPNAEETYIYTKALLELVLQSTARPKVLFVGGAVANFTDIAKTFDGVIKAINEVAEQLKEQQVQVFVRRGGPNQAVGLRRLEEALTAAGILGAVHDPTTPLTEAVHEALEVIHD